MSSSDKSQQSRGPGRVQANLDYWADRAEKNSEVAPRATRRADLPSTGKRMVLRDTDTAPKKARR